MNQESYRKLISGQNTNIVGTVIRVLLLVPAFIYDIIITIRNYFYSIGLLKSYKVDAKVISIGNITAGGTGKTPLVIWLSNMLKNKGFNVAILTRGYKSTENSKVSNHTDEPRILEQSCPLVPVIINANRVKGAKNAISKFGSEALIMDDGFQHRKLVRDLDIVTIDATNPFGYEKLLPAGLLRESIREIYRASAVVVTRSDKIEDHALSKIKKRLESLNPGITIATTKHTPTFIKLWNGKEIKLSQVQDKKIFAFCGIGNPAAFFNTLKELDCNLAGSKVYNDHHHYTNKDTAEIYETACNLNSDFILTTQKDWSKINIIDSFMKGADWGYLGIKLSFLTGEEKITQLIERVITGKI